MRFASEWSTEIGWLKRFPGARYKECQYAQFSQVPQQWKMHKTFVLRNYRDGPTYGNQEKYQFGHTQIAGPDDNHTIHGAFLIGPQHVGDTITMQLRVLVRYHGYASHLLRIRDHVSEDTQPGDDGIPGSTDYWDYQAPDGMDYTSWETGESDNAPSMASVGSSSSSA